MNECINYIQYPQLPGFNFFEYKKYMKDKLLKIYFKLLATFAKKYIKRHKPYIIWINGSVWKTSCRTIVYQTLKTQISNKTFYTSPKNFNWELWLPLSIFTIEKRTPNILQFVKTFFQTLFLSLFWSKKYDVIILEYWIDRPWEMDFLLNIAKPNIWIFTALDAVHSQQFWDPNMIAQEEVKMPLNTLDLVFLNNDEEYTNQIINHIQIDKITYQTLWHDTTPDINFSDEKLLEKEWKLSNQFNLKIKNQNLEITTNLIWKTNHWYIWVALAIADTINYKFNKKTIFKNNQKLKLNYDLLPGRLSIFQWLHNSILIDSTYNASPLSMRRLIDTTHTIHTNLKSKKEIWLVLWDMRELGDFTETEHRKLASYCMWIADKIFLVWEYMKEFFQDEIIKIGFNQSNISHFSDSKKLWKYLKKELSHNSKECIILIKWSQNTIFLEETTKLLLKNKSDENKLVRQSKFWMDKK